MNHYASLPDEPGIRHFALANALRKHGWTTSILACSVQHNTGKQRIHGKRLTVTQAVRGVTYRWFRLPGYKGSRFLRVVNMVGFYLRVISPGATHGLPRPDAVIGSQVHPLAALAGAILARRAGVPFYYEIRDLWPETLIQMGALKRGGLTARSMRTLERCLCNRAEAIITTMPFAYEYLVECGVPREKIVWISNGVDTSEFEIGEPDRDLDGAFQFTYFGSLGPANNVEILVKAFGELPQSKGLSFKIVGSGPSETSLSNLILEHYEYHNVCILPPVPRTDIPELSKKADCLVVGLLPMPLYNYGISLNKLYEYMASGRPIIFAGNARGNPVLLSGGGICTDGTLEKTAAAMREMISASPAQRRQWGAMNQEYAIENFDYSVLALRLAEMLGMHE